MATTAETTDNLPTAIAAGTETQKVPKVSHGRGGAANISQDDIVYVDGGIIREGVMGNQGDGPYSTGRGGRANIGSPGMKPTKTADHEIIPETALRDDRHEVFHTGRGGEGNLHHETSRTDALDSKEETEPEQSEKAVKKIEKEKKHPPPTHGGLGDKLKYKVFGRLYN